MSDREESNRLLIATFIVGTAVAVYFSNATLPVDKDSWQGFVVATLIVSLLISASLALLYVLARGYKLRYKKNRNTIVDRYSHHLYDASIHSYTWIILLSAIAYFLKWVDSTFQGDNQNVIRISLNVLIGIGIVAFINRDIFSSIKHRIKKSSKK